MKHQMDLYAARHLTGTALGFATGVSHAGHVSHFCPQAGADQAEVSRLRPRYSDTLPALWITPQTEYSL
jgi:hypothetical protein